MLFDFGSYLVSVFMVCWAVCFVYLVFLMVVVSNTGVVAVVIICCSVWWGWFVYLIPMYPFFALLYRWGYECHQEYEVDRCLPEYSRDQYKFIIIGYGSDEEYYVDTRLPIYNKYVEHRLNHKYATLTFKIDCCKNRYLIDITPPKTRSFYVTIRNIAKFNDVYHRIITDEYVYTTDGKELQLLCGLKIINKLSVCNKYIVDCKIMSFNKDKSWFEITDVCSENICHD